MSPFTDLNYLSTKAFLANLSIWHASITTETSKFETVNLQFKLLTSKLHPNFLKHCTWRKRRHKSHSKF